MTTENIKDAGSNLTAKVLTLDDVERLARGNRQERRMAGRLIKNAKRGRGEKA